MDKTEKISGISSSLRTTALALFVVYLISALLGLVRSRLLAGIFGDSPELGIFWLADKLPNLLFTFLVMSVTSAAFYPMFFDFKKRSNASADKFTSVLLNWSLLIYFFLFAIFFIYAETTSTYISWGSLSPSELVLHTQLLRVLLISQFPLILSSYLAFYLRTADKFIVPSLISVLSHVGVIIFTILYSNTWGIYATAFGALAGSFLGSVILLPFVYRLKYHYTTSLYLAKEDVKTLFSLSGPRFLISGTERGYSLLLNGLITFVYGPSYVVIYELANQLQNYPVNAFSMSFSQILFPKFSKYIAAKQIDLVRREMQKYFLLLSYYMLPLVMLFFVLRIPIVRIAFGGDQFSWLGTNLTAYTLAFFSLSMWMQTATQLFYRVFYSDHDSKTPTISGLITLAVSFVLSAILSWNMGFGVWALALSFSAGSTLGAFYIYWKYIKRFGGFSTSTHLSLVKIFYATLTSGVVTYSLMKLFDELIFDTTRTLPLLILTFIVVVIGLSVYLMFSLMLGLKQHEYLLNPIKERFALLLKR